MKADKDNMAAEIIENSSVNLFISTFGERVDWIEKYYRKSMSSANRGGIE